MKTQRGRGREYPITVKTQKERERVPHLCEDSEREREREYPISVKTQREREGESTPSL